MLEDLLQKAIGWATVTRGQDANGFVQVDAGDPKPIERVINLGAPGLYAKAKAGVKGILYRLLDGGVLLGFDTEPPSDVVDGEVGFFLRDSTGTFDVKIRIRDDGLVELRTGAGDTNIRIYGDGTVRIANATTVELGGATTVVLNGDPVLSGAILAAHTHGGMVPADPTLAAGATIGSASSTATLTKGG